MHSRPTTTAAIQACLPGEVEAGYLNVLITLAKSIDEFLAGYQLRIKSIPKLESAASLQGKICV
jgi:hypothetical protein